MVRKRTNKKKKSTPKYVVIARINMKSRQMSKKEADKLKADTKKKAPNATVTVKKA